MFERPITSTLIQLATSINRAHIAAILFGISLLFVIKETIIAEILKKIVTRTTHITINGVRIMVISSNYTTGKKTCNIKISCFDFKLLEYSVNSLDKPVALFFCCIADTAASNYVFAAHQKFTGHNRRF